MSQEFFKSFSDLQVLEAFNSALATSESWLLSDPLRFSEYEVSKTAPNLSDVDFANGDIISRPKQSGGTRDEVYPDILTATMLELALVRCLESNHPSPSAISSAAIKLRRETDSIYETWSNSLLQWIKSCLGEEQVIAHADIRDFFYNIRRDPLEIELANLLKDADGVQTVLRIFDELNSIDAMDKNRVGLPVAPCDFIWLMSDQILNGVDKTICHLPEIQSHRRWIDDFFMATSCPEESVEQLDHILSKAGFTLNHSKTSVVHNRSEFEETFLESAHRTVDRLFQDDFPPKQMVIDDMFRICDELEGRRSTQLIKRLYQLVAKHKISVYLPRTHRDIQQNPLAGESVLQYVGHLRWPQNVVGIVEDAFDEKSTDYRQLATIRWLIECSPSSQSLPKITELLKSNALEFKLHPFATAISLGFIFKYCSTSEYEAFAKEIAENVEHFKTALSLRLGCEFFFLADSTTQVATDIVRTSKDPLVNGLELLLESNSIAGIPRRLNGALRMSTGYKLGWGGLDRAIATRLLPRRLLPH